MEESTGKAGKKEVMKDIILKLHAGLSVEEAKVSGLESSLCSYSTSSFRI